MEEAGAQVQRSPRQSLELIVPPPAVSMLQVSSNASMQHLEVVLHDSRNQKMVVWDPQMGLAQVQSTQPAAPQVCPFCHQELPGGGSQWRDAWRYEQGMRHLGCAREHFPAESGRRVGSVP